MYLKSCAIHIVLIIFLLFVQLMTRLRIQVRQLQTQLQSNYKYKLVVRTQESPEQAQLTSLKTDADTIPRLALV